MPKRQRTAGVENTETKARPGGQNAADLAAEQVLWGNTVKAIKRVGNRILELTGTMEVIGKAGKASEETQRQLLEEVQQLIWVQDQTRGMVHVVAKWLERLDGVVVVSESELEESKVARKKQDKGKGKEVVREDKEVEESVKLEESVKSDNLEVEDVVKAPEISMLDADESMDVEK